MTEGNLGLGYQKKFRAAASRMLRNALFATKNIVPFIIGLCAENDKPTLEPGCSEL